MKLRFEIFTRDEVAMADPRLAWFPFYWQDFLGSDKVQLMTNEEVGLYVKLLLRQWDKGSIPDTLNGLKAIPNLKSNDDQTLLKLVSLCFAKRNGCRVNLKLAKIKQERLQYYERLSQAGAKGGQTKAKRSQATSHARTQLQPSSSKNSDSLCTNSESSRTRAPEEQDPWSPVLRGEISAEQYLAANQTPTPEPIPVGPTLLATVMQHVMDNRKTRT
jgi:uncharacterized protein YdaU (DUF1376 family)